MTYRRRFNYTLGKKAIKNMRRYKLGVYPLLDTQNLPAIYFLHKNVQKIQWFADKVLDCPRAFIHKKDKYFYIKAMGVYIDKWVKYTKRNPEWKELW